MSNETLRWWGLILALLLLAFGLRTWNLETVPPGLTHDEAANGHDSAAILRGVHRLYFPVGYGREPLYNYSVAAITSFLGQGIFTLRVASVFWSLLTWSLTVALARRWFGRRAALLAAALLTCTFWPLMLARVGLRAITLPALFTASLLSFDHALHTHTTRQSIGVFLISGVFLGACFYTYMASRGLPVVYLTLLVVCALWNRPLLRRMGWGVALTVGAALLIGLPLYLHLRANPGLEYRLTQLGGPLTALRAGDWRPAWHNISASLPFLGLRGDPLWLYNIGGRPSVDTFTAAGFWIGTLIAVWRVRDYRHAALLLWLAGGVAPALLTGPEATALRTVAALPAIYILAAVGFEWVWRGIARIGSRARSIVTGALTVALLFTCGETTYAYFVTWGQDRDVHVLYHHHVVALGRYLESNASDTPVAITSLYPGEFHDPYTMEVTLRREDLDLRWSNGQGALFFPHGETRLYTETQAAPAMALLPWISSYSHPEVTLTYRENDLPPATYGYRWDADAAWRALSAELYDTIYTAPGDPPPGVTHNATLCPIVYGEAVALTGYRVTPHVPHPGDVLTVLTAWEVQAPHPEELVLFTHLLGMDNVTVTQADRLDAPSWQWQAGDRFVQAHTLALPDTMTPGDYNLVIGFYTRAGLQRVTIDEVGPITRILIPLEVSP